MDISVIAATLFSPIFVVVATIVLGVLMRKWSLPLLSGAFLLVSSLPVAADRFYAAAQGDQLRSQPDAVAAADAVIVLGGSVHYVRGVHGPTPEWGDSVDRFFGGAELIRAKRAPKIIFSGGTIFSGELLPSEGEVAARYAGLIGVPAETMLVTAPARDTADEARIIRKTFATPSPRVILVTSAFHMKRAQMLFERVGFEVIPYPVDIRIPYVRRPVESWLPNPYALRKTDFAIREFLGRAYYRVERLFGLDRG